MEELLRTWASRCENEDEDVIMDDDLAAEADLAQLRKCVDQYRDRLEENPWIQSLLTSL